MTDHVRCDRAHDCRASSIGSVCAVRVFGEFSSMIQQKRSHKSQVTTNHRPNWCKKTCAEGQRDRETKSCCASESRAVADGRECAVFMHKLNEITLNFNDITAQQQQQLLSVMHIEIVAAILVYICVGETLQVDNCHSHFTTNGHSRAVETNNKLISWVLVDSMSFQCSHCVSAIEIDFDWRKCRKKWNRMDAPMKM